MDPSRPLPPADLSGRLVSLDAYRGFIMLTMASAGLGLARIWTNLETAASVSTVWGMLGGPVGPLSAVGWVAPGRADAAPVSGLWHFLGYQFEHVDWVGCAFWDLIQPSFMFMVGVAMPFSLASRAARGDGWWTQFGHAIWRAAVLVLLAVFLSSPPSGIRPGHTVPLTNWIFPNVLAQIGLGYVFLFLLAGRGFRVQLGAAVAILVGYWAFFALWPLPPTSFDPKSVGVPPTFPQLEGFFAHWNKNTNAAHHFDVWFLNLFPRPEPFDYNRGGYQTLNFVPSLATMIFGLMAGEMLRRAELSNVEKFGRLVLAAAVCLAVGWLMGQTVVPIVKRIWTPSWAVYSAGWTFAILAVFFAIIDVLGYKGWSWPLVVVGVNSIAMYLMSQLMSGWVRSRWVTHLGAGAFQHPYAPLLLSVLTLLVLWLACLWLYRKRVFLRI